MKIIKYITILLFLTYTVYANEQDHKNELKDIQNNKPCCQRQDIQLRDIGSAPGQTKDMKIDKKAKKKYPDEDEWDEDREGYE